jgi:hypothetical protein
MKDRRVWISIEDRHFSISDDLYKEIVNSDLSKLALYLTHSSKVVRTVATRRFEYIRGEK